MRELRYRTGRAGFRVREVTLVTTLVDAELYPLVELAELYRKRWEARDESKALEDDDENGCVALRDGRRGEQGAVDVRVGVQPGPGGDAGGVATPGGARGSRSASWMRCVGCPRPVPGAPCRSWWSIPIAPTATSPA